MLLADDNYADDDSMLRMQSAINVNNIITSAIKQNMNDKCES